MRCLRRYCIRRSMMDERIGIITMVRLSLLFLLVATASSRVIHKRTTDLNSTISKVAKSDLNLKSDLLGRPLIGGGFNGVCFES